MLSGDSFSANVLAGQSPVDRDVTFGVFGWGEARGSLHLVMGGVGQ